uniref:Col_cuticle_N domain-containing protein n=1 Tax=Steinernema glaseri TaxID=37863 RepID=A0A1I7ZXC7_9BILA
MEPSEALKVVLLTLIGLSSLVGLIATTVCYFKMRQIKNLEKVQQAAGLPEAKPNDESRKSAAPSMKSQTGY